MDPINHQKQAYHLLGLQGPQQTQQNHTSITVEGKKYHNFWPISAILAMVGGGVVFNENPSQYTQQKTSTALDTRQDRPKETLG